MKEERKYNVLAIGELNVDLILNDIQGFPVVGKEILANNMTITLGSSTAIFAANLSGLGAKVAFLGKTGSDDFGAIVINSLQQRNVATEFLIADPNLATGATIVMNYGEDRANVTHMGAMEHLSIDDIKPAILRQTNHIHFSSCFLQPGIKKDLSLLFKMAKKAGCTTSMDTQWDPDEKWDLELKSILPFVDIFMPNESELCLITNKTSWKEALNSIKEYANIVIVKRGNKGSAMLTNEKMIIEKPAFLNTNVIDAIGAGDSFNAGFIFKFINGRTPEECQEFGNLTGAINTTASGGTTAFVEKSIITKAAATYFNQNITL